MRAAETSVLGAERLHSDRDRPRNADRIRHVQLAPVREPGRDDVLRDAPRRVRSQTVDLGRVLA
jgi:hypothetical protein